MLIKCPQMFTGHVGPVEVSFYWPKAIFGIFYWPGAIGPLYEPWLYMLCPLFWLQPITLSEFQRCQATVSSRVSRNEHYPLAFSSILAAEHVPYTVPYSRSSLIHLVGASEVASHGYMNGGSIMSVRGVNMFSFSLQRLSMYRTLSLIPAPVSSTWWERRRWRPTAT